MSPLVAPFVIIMNDDLQSSYMQWRVVHRDPTLAAARLHNRYASVIASFPRDHYKAVLVEAKTLVHAPSGIVKWGAVYKLSEIVARARKKKFAAPVGANGKRVNRLRRPAKAHGAPLGKKKAAPDDQAFAPIIISKKGKPVGRRAVAPLVKAAKAPKRKKI